MILHNEKGMKKGERTTPIAVSAEAWEALLRIERVSDITDKCDVKYKLHRLTNADLSLFLFLYKVCNVKGEIKDLQEGYKHHLYRTLCTYYERPISTAQFYVSFEKLQYHQLFDIHHHEMTGLYTIKLCHFLNDETGKPHRYVPVSPIIFTNEFASLTLAAKKLYLHLFMQHLSGYIHRKLTGETGLYTFLRKTHPHHLRAVFTELTTSLGVYPALCTTATLEKSSYTYTYARFSLNPHYMEKNQTEYREPMTSPLKYPRKASFIQTVLNQLGIGELSSQLSLLVNCLKNQGHAVIRYALYRVQQYVQTNGMFPSELAYFLKKETRQKRESEILHIAAETGIEPLLAPKLVGDDRKQRLFEFALHFSSYSLSQLRVMFKKARTLLDYTVVGSGLHLHDYKFESPLTGKIGGLFAVRMAAYHRQISPDDLLKLEWAALIHFSFEQEREMCHWLLEQVDKLPKMITVPSIIKLEDFIDKHCLNDV
ncbi:hypothetical protein [Metabacillus iocasae]|uniref:Replication initiation protein n=1 Tax=Priestia iocasae TaxID=2291674 RepID=A0ABS2QU28_9BACI|nr:hypothetical protein [Metabacillus iocasae]MBM7702932.1 hypothetical protein [Metabacillus iocasae]